MQHVCRDCNKLLEENDLVNVNVTSRYHILKSTVAYALDKYCLVAHSDTLRHINCQWPKGNQEDASLD